MVGASDMWLSKFRAAEQLGQEIMELINEKNKGQRLGTSNSKVNSSIRVKLQTFSQEIKDLKDELMRSATSNLITPREAERRQYQIDQLISKEKQLNNAFKPKDSGYQSGYERSGLLNEGFDSSRDAYASARGGSDWGDMSPADIRSRQQQLIDEQDKGLDVLSEVIQRQKMMGQNIGEEVDYHNELIDEIQDHVDTTERRLIKENRHVKRVTKKAGSCALILVVVLLLIAIIVVGVVPK